MSSQGFEVRLTANVDSYTSAMTKAEASTKSMSSSSSANMAKLGGQMQKVGGELSRNVTLPLVGAGVAAIAMSSKYETAFARMEGLAGVTADEVDGLKASVLDLSGRTAQAPQDLADALYQASSSGLDTATAMAAVEVAAKGAAAGMGSAADIVGLVASAVASYGSANINAAKATDILTAAIREGRADPAELAGTLGRVLPIANAVGISFEEVGGATAYLSNIMGDTNRTVTSLQGLLVKLASPTAQGRQALLDMGTSAAELQASIDKDGLLGALDLLKTHGFQENSQAMTQLFDDIEGRQGALALMADESGTLAATMDKVAHSAGSLDSAFTVVTNTSGFKMKQAWAEIQVALIQAGDAIMPIVSGIAGGIAKLAGIFGDLPKPVQMIVIGFLAMAAAAGPLLALSGSMIKNYKEVKTALTSAATGATVTGLAFGALGLVMVGATAWYAENARKKAELVAITNDFVAALKDEADGQQGAVDAAIAKGLSDQKLIDAGKKLNISVSDMAKIIRGEVVPAYANWQKAADKYGITVGTTNQVQNQVGTQTKVTAANIAELGAAFSFVNSKLAPLNDGFENANSQLALSTQVERELNEVFGQGTASIVEHGGAAGRAADSLKGLTDVVAQVPDVTDEETAAIKSATDALNAQVKALQDDLTAQEALLDFARRAADAQYALAASTDDYDRFLEDLPGKLDDIDKSKDTDAEKTRQINQLYRDGSKLAASMADDVVTAYDDASNGATTAKQKGDLWRESMLNSALAASGPVRQSILDYVLAVNEVPAEKQTAIVAAIDAGDLTTAIALLDGASETRKVEVQADVDDKSLGDTNRKLGDLEDPLHAKLIVDADTSLANGKITLMLGRAGTFHQSAAGRFVDHPMVSTLGEGGLPEVVFPLTKPGRIAELMSDRRVSGPIFGAVGGGPVRSAEGRVVNLTHMSVPASGTSVAGGGTDQDKVMEREFQRDAISYEVYRAYLMKRKEGLALYSDDEQDLFDRIQQLDETQAKRRDDDAQAQTDTADRIQKYLFDTNQISLGDYEKYLEGRRGSYAQYTAEWFALSGQIIDIQHQMDSAAQAATAAVFDQAHAVQSLADANQANNDADAEYNAAAAKVASTNANRGSTVEDKQSAVDEFNRAATAHANTAFNLREAQAANQGLLPGTPDWAKFMRKELIADIAYSHAIGRDNLANAIDRLLLGIPSFAGGGYIPATPGGRLIRVAEAGQGEYMTPANRIHAMAGSGGTTTVNNYYRIDVGTALDRPAVARELSQLLREHDRVNGRN